MVSDILLQRLHIMFLPFGRFELRTDVIEVVRIVQTEHQAHVFLLHLVGKSIRVGKVAHTV